MAECDYFFQVEGCEYEDDFRTFWAVILALDVLSLVIQLPLLCYTLHLDNWKVKEMTAVRMLATQWIIMRIAQDIFMNSDKHGQINIILSSFLFNLSYLSLLISACHLGRILLVAASDEAQSVEFLKGMKYYALCLIPYGIFTTGCIQMQHEFNHGRKHVVGNLKLVSSQLITTAMLMFVVYIVLIVGLGVRKIRQIEQSLQNMASSVGTNARVEDKIRRLWRLRMLVGGTGAVLSGGLVLYLIARAANSRPLWLFVAVLFFGSTLPVVIAFRAVVMISAKSAAGSKTMTGGDNSNGMSSNVNTNNNDSNNVNINNNGHSNSKIVGGNKNSNDNSMEMVTSSNSKEIP